MRRDLAEHDLEFDAPFILPDNDLLPVENNGETNLVESGETVDEALDVIETLREDEPACGIGALKCREREREREGVGGCMGPKQVNNESNGKPSARNWNGQLAFRRVGSSGFGGAVLRVQGLGFARV